MKTLLRLLVIFVIVAGSQSVRAAEMIIQVNQAPVYKEADPNSEVITTVYKGDKIKVSNKPVPGFQKVMVGNNIGYIKNADLRMGGAAGKKQTTMTAGSAQKQTRAPQPGLRNKWSLALFGGINYQYQGTRSNTEPDGTIENYGVLTGIGTRFGVGVQFPLSPRVSGKIYGELKSIAVTGTGEIKIPPATDFTPVDFYLKTQFMSFGFLGQYYFKHKFWGGIGLQYDIPRSGTTKAGSNPEAAMTSSQLVSFINMYGAIGYDFPLSNKLFLVTDARLGALFSRPIILEGDATLSISYAF